MFSTEITDCDEITVDELIFYVYEVQLESLSGMDLYTQHIRKLVAGRNVCAIIQAIPIADMAN